MWVKSYKRHNNDSGAFQELLHIEDMGKFGQLSFLEIAPEATRGGHLHHRKREWFVCIKGIVKVSLEGSDGVIEEFYLNEMTKEVLEIPINTKHWVTNLDLVDSAELMIVCNEVYDENDHDTWTNWEEGV